MNALMLDAPVAVGGVGGSGTRLVASILLELGFYLGRDLNPFCDNLWFTLLFKRLAALDCSTADFGALYRIFEKAMCGAGDLTQAELRRIAAASIPYSDEFDAEWLSQRAESLIRECAGPPRKCCCWGWKEPNTHVVLPRLKDLIPRLRYIHVVRNGLDLAYSENQNQLRLWGARFLGVDRIEISPRFSLKYWAAVHRRVLAAGSEMGGRFLLINFDRLCANPSDELPRLLEFLGFEASPERLAASTNLIHSPETIGRFKLFPRDDFDPEDVALVRSIGFDTEYP